MYSLSTLGGLRMRVNEASYEDRGVVNVQRGVRAKRVVAAFIVTVLTLVAMLDVAALASDARDRGSLSGLDYASSEAFASGLKAFGLATASAKEGDDEKAKKYFDGDDDSFTKRKQTENGFRDTSMDAGDSVAMEDGDKSTPGNDWMTTADQATKITNDDGSNRSSGSGDEGDKAKDFGDTFSMVIRRLWPGYYISSNLEIAPKNAADTWDVYSSNYAECTDLDEGHKAVIGIEDGEKQYSSYVVEEPTLQNSNCDIPGIGTEGVQDLMALFDGHGVNRADRQTAKTPFGLGVATELLPTDDVPVKDSDRADKYTGLELFGYNLRWSEYNGEWDHVKVNTAVRLKSSMTFGQGLATLGQAISEGIGAAAGSIAHDVGDKFESGDWFGGLLAAINPMTYIDAVAAGVGTAMYRVLANVMNGFEFTALKNGNWYRPNFAAETQYGVRTLTQVEKNAIIIAKVKKITEGSVQGLPDADDLLNYDEATERTRLSPPPAPSVEECKDCMGTASATGRVQSWDDWKEANKDRLENIGRTELGLDIDSFDSVDGDAQKKYDALLKAWNSAVDAKVSQGREDKVNSSYNTIAELLKEAIKQQVSDEIMNRPAQAWLYCTDKNGDPSGEPADPDVKAAVDAGLMTNPGKEAYGPKGDQPWQCDQPERPTIVGGLLGTARKNVSGKYVDTRRTAYVGVNVLDMLVGNRIDEMGQTALTWSQNVTMVLNTIIGWCFQPLLDQLGVKDVIVDWLGKLRDTIYFQLVVLIMAFAGLIIMRRLVTGHPIESFKQIAIVILTFGLGVMLLFAPKNMVALVDDVPTALERAAIGTIFQSSGNDVLCSATGSPKGTVSTSQAFNDLFGNDTGFNPDSQVRTLQCRVWETFVVTPWSYGQWGTNINQLWADGYASTQQISSNSGQLDVSDDVAKLVGDAAVKMGGGVTINNWGVYQIYTQTSGTSTTEDYDRPVKTTDKNIYRIVDAQAGPDNGAGRDSTHFATWSGRTGNKFLVGVSAFALSVLGLLAIGGLALKKLEYTFTSIILLLCSPFMLLMGLLPGKNQMRLRQYGFEILGLCIKRIITVVFMCVALEIMLEIASGSDADWGSTFCGLFAILLMLKMYRAELLAMMTKNVDDRSGGWNKADDAISNYVKSDPTLLGVADAVKNTTLAVAGTAIGSALAGQFHNPNSVGRIQQRMIKAYAEGGTAEADLARENRRYEDTKAAINKKYAGKTDVISQQRMQAELARNEAVHNQYLANYNRNKKLATTLANARGAYGHKTYVDEDGKVRRRTVKDSLSSIMSAAVAYEGARNSGQFDQYKKDVLTPAQVASDRLAVLMNRTRAVRIRQGKTSAVMEAYRNSTLNWQRREMQAQQELMSRIQANRVEAPTINAQGAISLTAADSVMNSGRTMMSYGMSKNLGMTDEQLQILVANAPNKQQLLADWQVAEQSGDWNQVRADLGESAAMQEGTEAYRQLWRPKANQVEDAKNEAILEQHDKTEKAWRRLADAEFLYGQAVDMGDDKRIRETSKQVRAARKDYMRQHMQLTKMTEDKGGKFTKKLTAQILASNAGEARRLMAIEQRKDEASAVREKAMEKILGKDYVEVKRHEQSADGKRAFEDTMRSATMKWQASLEIADKLESDGQKEAADAMRASANEALKSARKGLLRSRQMADEWESSFEGQLTDLHAAHAEGRLSDDKYEEKVMELFSAAEAIKTSNETLAAIEGAQSLLAEEQAKATAKEKLERLKASIDSGEYDKEVLDLAERTDRTPEAVVAEQIALNSKIIDQIDEREKDVKNAVGLDKDSGKDILDKITADSLPTAMMATKIRKQAEHMGLDGGAAANKDVNKTRDKLRRADDSVKAAKKELAASESKAAEAEVHRLEKKKDKIHDRLDPMAEAFADSYTRASKQAAAWMEIADDDIEAANKSLYFDNVIRQSEAAKTLDSTDILRDYESAQMSFGGGAMDSTVYDPYTVAAAAVEDPSVIRTDKIKMRGKIYDQITKELQDDPDTNRRRSEMGPISMQSGVLMETSIREVPAALFGSTPTSTPATPAPDSSRTEGRGWGAPTTTPSPATGKTDGSGWGSLPASVAGSSEPISPTMGETASKQDNAPGETSGWGSSWGGSKPWPAAGNNGEASAPSQPAVAPWPRAKSDEIAGKLGLDVRDDGISMSSFNDLKAIADGLDMKDMKASELRDPVNAIRQQGVSDQELEGLASALSSTDDAGDLAQRVADFHSGWLAEHGDSTKPASSAPVQAAPAATTPVDTAPWDNSPISDKEKEVIRGKINKLKDNDNWAMTDFAAGSLATGWGLVSDTQNTSELSARIFDDPVEELRSRGASNADIRNIADFASDFADNTPTRDLRPSVLEEALARQKRETDSAQRDHKDKPGRKFARPDSLK